jgi:hypothetical protein
MRFVMKPTFAALVVSLYPVMAAACSEDTSPGVWEHNRVVVRWLLALSLTLLTTTAVLYFARHRKGLLVLLVSVLLIIFHPAWIYRGGGGDCGISMAEGARNSAILLAIGVAYQFAMWLVKRRAPIQRRA